MKTFDNLAEEFLDYKAKRLREVGSAYPLDRLERMIVYNFGSWLEEKRKSGELILTFPIVREASL